jgi:TIR domain
MTKRERLERLRQLRIKRKPGAAFSSHYACLEWIDKVAPLLKYGDQRHYNNFQQNAQFVRMPQLSADRLMTHLNAMISTVNQAIAELEIHSDSEPVPEQASKPTESGMPTKETELDIFISHSGQDQQIASVLIDLLRTAMDIPPKRIRCTSVDGYRLPGGASTDDQLKREVRETKCFIALLTRRSIRFTYVLFELGARWGAKLPFIPLLAAGLNAHELEGPVSGLNALSCASNSQLHQLITDVHRIIGGAKNEPSAYDAKLQALRSLSEEAAATPGNPAAKADKESPQLKKKELSDAAKEFWG